MTASNCVSADELRSRGLTEAGVNYVLHVSNSPPDRKVGRRRRRNLILHVPMPALGVSLQAESLSGEFFFLVQLNGRNDICAAYDQPIRVPLQITDRAGRRTRISYTADYLVVDGNQVAVYEVKADFELERLLDDRPSDWRRDVDGYHYLPAERHFAELGIKHIVVPISQLSSVRGDNLRLLQASRRQTDTKQLRKMRHIVHGIVASEYAIRGGELLERLGCSDATAILQLIDQELIFASLDQTILSDIENVWLSSSQSDVDIIQQSDKHLTQILLGQPTLSTSDVLGGKYLADVAIRMAIIDGATRIGRRGKEVSARTVRRYRKLLKDGGGDIRCLKPKWEVCGNNDARIGATHLSAIIGSIREGRRDTSCPSVHACYQSYQASHGAFGDATELYYERPVSRATYYRLWEKAQHTDSDALERGGRRLQNAQADVFDPISKTIIATRAFETAHIDHWKADLFVVIGYLKGKKLTARPWVTAMVDSFTGEILALWMSLAAPSKKSCSMVIRDCVRRHGRLPEMLVVDGGSEFRSVHFAVMLATFGVIRCERPPEDPRFGKEVERLFGHFKEKFARGLPGFGLSIEQARAVSGPLKAHRTATLTTSSAFEILERYAFHGYNFSKNSSGTIKTRTDMRLESTATFPSSGIAITWGLPFMIATSIDAPQAAYTLFRGRGIHVDGKWYTSPALLRYYGFKKDMQVRLEPFDSSITYVCIDEKWLICRNTSTSYHAALSDRRLVDEARERHELRALRREIQGQLDAEAASIVRNSLDQIAKRPATPDPTLDSDKPSGNAFDNARSSASSDGAPLEELDEF